MSERKGRRLGRKVRRTSKKARSFPIYREPRVAGNDGRLGVIVRQYNKFLFTEPFRAPAATALFPYQLEYAVCTNPNILIVTSTSPPFWNSFKAMYRKYRVYKSKIEFTVVNTENFPVEAFVCPVNFVPNLTVSPIAYYSQPGSKSSLVSPKGGLDRVRLTSTTSPATWGGSANTAVEDAYVGTTDNSAPPSDNIYWIYGVDTIGNASVAGITFNIKIWVWLSVFEPNSPSS